MTGLKKLGEAAPTVKNLDMVTYLESLIREVGKIEFDEEGGKRKEGGTRSEGIMALVRLRDSEGSLPIIQKRRKKVSIHPNAFVRKQTNYGDDNSNNNNTSKKIEKDNKTLDSVSLNSTHTEKEGATTRSMTDPTIENGYFSNEPPKKDIDNENNDINIIINYKNFISLMTDSMVCRMCKSSMNENCFHRTSCGLATTIYYQCSNKNCNHQQEIRPEMVETNNKWKEMIDDNDELENKDEKEKKKSDNTNSIGSYAINLQLFLWLQQFGLSGSAARQLASSLCLTQRTRLFNDFTALEEKIALHEIILTKMIIDDNVAEEMAISPMDENGKSKLTVTMDAGWNNRGSGRSCNSASCQHIVYGGRTSKIVALHTMSRECIKCTNGKKHIVEYTLDQLESSLDPTSFFRINRQVILSPEAIKKISIWFNSRLKLELNFKNDINLVVSRDRVSRFKQWLYRQPPNGWATSDVGRPFCLWC